MQSHLKGLMLSTCTVRYCPSVTGTHQSPLPNFLLHCILTNLGYPPLIEAGLEANHVICVFTFSIGNKFNLGLSFKKLWQSAKCVHTLYMLHLTYIPYIAYSGIANGVARGAECHPDSENLPKIRRKEEKLKRKGKNWDVSFTLPLLTDRDWLHMLLF